MDIFVKQGTGLYDNDDLQKMLNTLQVPEYRHQFLECVSEGHDKSAIIDCILDGFYERFERYDSDVCEQFIAAYKDWTVGLGLAEPERNL